MPHLKGTRWPFGRDYKYAITSWDGEWVIIHCSKCLKGLKPSHRVDKEYLCDDCQPRHRDGT